jgi:small subunit ribosomal protein S16
LTISLPSLKSVGNALTLFFVLVIRLNPTGRKKQLAYRIVLAEKSQAVNSKFQEILGFYNPSDGKKIEFDEDRIKHWISMGACPSDTVAGLLKYNGVAGLEQFMAPRNLKRKKKGAVEEEKVEVAAEPTEEPKEEVKVEEAAPEPDIPKDAEATPPPAEE